MHQKNKLKLTPYLLVILLICSVIQHGLAQEESISYSTEEKEKRSGHKYSDIDQYEQNFLIKANITGVSGFLSTGNYGVFINSIGAEYKILPALSLDVEGMFSGALNPNGISWINAGVRYYPSKRIGSRAKKDRVNNFSGTYLRLAYGTQIDRFSRTSALPDGYEFSLGRQQKVGKWGYLDVSGLLTYNRTFGIFTFNTRIAGGVAYGFTRERKDHHEEEIQKYEISWNRPILSMDYLFLQASRDFVSAGLAFSGQFHLGNYWVVIPSLSGGYAYNSYLKRNGFDVANPEYYTYAGSLSIRKFIGVKKRLEAGHKAKSYSGYFISLAFPAIYSRVESWEIEGFESFDRNQFNFQPFIGLGLQEKVGNRFLFNGSWNVGYSQFTESFRVNASVGISILLHY